MFATTTRRLDDGSPVSREVHAGFCERREVRLLPATHLVVHCHTRQQALEVKARLAEWLTPRGLVFNEDKTKVVSLSDGYDFLGFNVRRYHGKLLIKPAKRPSDESGKGSATSCAPCTGATLRRCSNGSTRSSGDGLPTTGHRYPPKPSASWTPTCGGSHGKWAKRSHSTKPAYWVFARYFGTFNKARQDRWVFGDRTSGSYLHRFAWTNIVRHQIVKHQASPDDPELADYWAWRRHKRPCRSTAPPCGSTEPRTDAARSARPRSSPPHTAPTLHATGSTGWPPLARRSTSSGTQPERTPLHPDSSTSTATTIPASHQGLLEPDARKRARPVLRGARRREALGLPALAHPRLTVRALPRAAEGGQAGVGRGAWLRLSGRAVSERGVLPPSLLRLPRSDSAAAHGRAQQHAVADRPNHHFVAFAGLRLVAEPRSNPGRFKRPPGFGSRLGRWRVG